MDVLQDKGSLGPLVVVVAIANDDAYVCRLVLLFSS